MGRREPLRSQCAARLARCAAGGPLRTSILRRPGRGAVRAAPPHAAGPPAARQGQPRQSSPTGAVVGCLCAPSLSRTILVTARRQYGGRLRGDGAHTASGPASSFRGGGCVRSQANSSSGEGTSSRASARAMSCEEDSAARGASAPSAGHLLNIGRISGQQRGALGQCDARNLQIHRPDAHALLLQFLRNRGCGEAEGEQGDGAKQLKVTLHEAVGGDLLLKRS